MSAVYFEFQFLTGKDRQTKDILISGLSDIGFESFMDDETGFLGYVQETEFNQGTWPIYSDDAMITAMEKAETKAGKINTEGQKLCDSMSYSNTVDSILSSIYKN